MGNNIYLSKNSKVELRRINQRANLDDIREKTTMSSSLKLFFLFQKKNIALILLNFSSIKKAESTLNYKMGELLGQSLHNPRHTMHTQKITSSKNG